MIFVTLGSQKFQFNRLLIKIDELVEQGVIQEEIFAQIGYSDYKPKHYEYSEFLDRDAYAKKMEMSDIVITHAGTGAIIGAVKKEKKVIAVPRLVKYGEHVDNHQLQIIDQFEGMELISPCTEIEQLKLVYKELDVKEFRAYQSNTQIILNSIEKFLEDK